MTREQILAFRRRAGGLDERLPLSRAARAAVEAEAEAQARSLPLPGEVAAIDVVWST